MNRFPFMDIQEGLTVYVFGELDTTDGCFDATDVDQEPQRLAGLHRTQERAHERLERRACDRRCDDDRKRPADPVRALVTTYRGTDGIRLPGR